MGLGFVVAAEDLAHEVVAVRHQFDQEFVTDAGATTATFGLTATPWDDVVRATAGKYREALERLTA